jgi:hypothetical protein
MTPRRTISELMMLFRAGNRGHSQKIMRALLAAEGTDWTRWGKPERLRAISALVFGPADRVASNAPRLPPMRLGGRFDPHDALDDDKPELKAREARSPARPRRPGGS